MVAGSLPQQKISITLAPSELSVIRSSVAFFTHSPKVKSLPTSDSMTPGFLHHLFTRLVSSFPTPPYPLPPPSPPISSAKPADVSSQETKTSSDDRLRRLRSLATCSRSDSKMILASNCVVSSLFSSICLKWVVSFVT